MALSILVVFSLLVALIAANTQYLDIAGVVKCDGKGYKGATVLAVDKGEQTTCGIEVKESGTYAPGGKFLKWRGN